MTEDHNYLPHFINEEIYVFDEEADTGQTTETAPAPTQTIEASEPQVEYEKPSPLQFEGKNLKNVVVLVPHNIKEEIDFLQKVLSAVKLTLDDCALLSMDKNEGPIQLDELAPKYILAFGTTDAQYPLAGDFYQISEEGSVKKLKADNLTTISTDNGKKKQLWEALQVLFILK